MTHTGAIIDYYSELYRKVFGRDTKHVTLLHANQLNADTIEQILLMFERRQFRFVSLADAQFRRCVSNAGHVSDEGGADVGVPLGAQPSGSD